MRAAATTCAWAVQDRGGPLPRSDGERPARGEGRPGLPLFDDASIEPYGAKLLGNHRFTDLEAEGPGAGYVSPGHVSAWADPEGRTCSCSCTAGSRAPGSSTRSACTASTSVTTAGRSSPRTATRRARRSARALPHRSQLEGDWQLVDHGRHQRRGRGLPADPPAPQRDDQRCAHGRWRLEAGHRAAVVLDGDLPRSVHRGWRESAGAWTTTFTVLGPDGRSLWGTQDGPGGALSREAPVGRRR